MESTSLAPAEQLERAWERTDRLFGLIDPRALLERPIRLRNPLLFYLGHLPAFSRNFLCGEVLGRRSPEPDLDRLFAFGIDPETEAEVPDEPDWPRLDEVRAYRDRVREELRAGAGQLPDCEHPMADGQRAVHLVVEHELMHHETLLYALQELPPEALRAPSESAPEHEEWTRVRTGDARVAAEWLRIPAGEVRLGARFDELEFGWDNEFPERRVVVPAVEVESAPVTLERFRAFVEDGGYERPELWSERGWEWVSEHGLAHPKDWTPEGTGWRVRSLFASLPLDEVRGWPASVAYAEAVAFARWSEARLPTEAEWVRAALTTPEGAQRSYPWGEEAPDAGRGNLNFAGLAPTPVGAYPAGRSPWGLEETLGNGWEWTSTVFDKHPGFVDYVPGYSGYSKDFFDGAHQVVLGGSWGTDAKLLRPSFRNWYRYNYPYPFTKFRLVRDV